MQFEHINATIEVFQDRGQPVISVDASLKGRSSMRTGIYAGISTARVIALLALASLPLRSPAQEVQPVTAAGEKAILSNPGTDPMGAKNAGVTVVEYFDYNCPYCKKLAHALHTLLGEDHRVAVLYKDWPILGEVSVYAARSALAARWQGKYLVAHDALMNGPRLAQDDQVDAILQRAGLNIEELKRDRKMHAEEIDNLLARNDAEAHALHLQGTPGVVVGRQLAFGVSGVSDLEKLVASARHGQ